MCYNFKRDVNIDKEVQQQKKAAAAAALAAKKHSLPTTTFEEKNFLSLSKPASNKPQGDQQRRNSISRKKPLTNLRRKSLLMKKTTAPLISIDNLDEEIKQLQLRSSIDVMGGGVGRTSPLRRLSSPLGAKATSSSGSSAKNSIEPINFKQGSVVSHPHAPPATHHHFLSNFENRLASIGKLDAKKVDASLPPHRSSTPDDERQHPRKSSTSPNSK